MKYRAPFLALLLALSAAIFTFVHTHTVLADNSQGPYQAVAPGAVAPPAAIQEPDGNGNLIPPGNSNPSSTFTRPGTTPSYSGGQLIASASGALSSFTLTGAPIVPRVRLSTNATTGWGIAVTVNIWNCQPTYTGGDAATYGIATGGACWVGSIPVTLTQWGDAASGQGSWSVGTNVVLSPGTYYWDLQTGTSASATGVSGQTFSLTLEESH